MLTGGCQCGALRYEYRGELGQVYICHCSQCRRQSGSAFGISVLVDPGLFGLTSGRFRRWRRQGDSGRRIDSLFCADCGSRLMHELVDLGLTVLKPGTLDLPFDIGDAIHIHTADALPGVQIPGAARTYPNGID